MTRSVIRLAVTAEDRRIARLAAAAIALLKLADAAIPMPLPGVKPGLANIVTLIVLARHGWGAAAWVSGLRVLVGALLLGQLFTPGFFLSLDRKRVQPCRAGPSSAACHAVSAGRSAEQSSPLSRTSAASCCSPGCGSFRTTGCFTSCRFWPRRRWASVSSTVCGRAPACRTGAAPRSALSAARNPYAMTKTVCLALTGASGMPYGLRLLECLLAAGCRRSCSIRRWRPSSPARR